jgi:hypothetical protein
MTATEDLCRQDPVPAEIRAVDAQKAFKSLVRELSYILLYLTSAMLVRWTYSVTISSSYLSCVRIASFN